MDLDFTAEQDLLRETVARRVPRHAALDVVRAMEDDPSATPRSSGSSSPSSACIGLTLPEEYGGSG